MLDNGYIGGFLLSAYAQRLTEALTRQYLPPNSVHGVPSIV